MNKLLITGGAGFIGFHVLRRFVQNYPNYQIYNLDALTYAGNLENLKDIENYPNYHFIKADITDGILIKKNYKEYFFDGVIHLVKQLCKQMDVKFGGQVFEYEKLITYIKGRLDHDLRYVIDATKINKELGWKHSVTFEQGLAKTIDWYLANEKW